MKNTFKVHIYSAITILIWGCGFPFTRAIGDEIGPYALAFERCFLAAVILIILGRFTGLRKPFEKKDFLWFFLSGFFGFSAYSVFYNMGLATLDSATGCMITAIGPILTAIAVLKLYDEKINKIGWITMVTAFIGVGVLLMWGNGLNISIGALWMFLCALCFTGYSVLTRRFTKQGYTAMEVVTYSVIFAAIQLIFFLPAALSDISHASLVSNLAAIYMGVMTSAAAYYTWSKALEITDNTSTVTNYLYVNPIVAAVVGFVLLSEVPGPGFYIGGAITLISVIIFSLKGNE